MDFLLVRVVDCRRTCIMFLFDNSVVREIVLTLLYEIDGLLWDNRVERSRLCSEA